MHEAARLLGGQHLAHGHVHPPARALVDVRRQALVEELAHPVRQPRPRLYEDLVAAVHVRQLGEARLASQEGGAHERTARDAVQRTHLQQPPLLQRGEHRRDRAAVEGRQTAAAHHQVKVLWVGSVRRCLHGVGRRGAAVVERELQAAQRQGGPPARPRPRLPPEGPAWCIRQLTLRGVQCARGAAPAEVQAERLLLRAELERAPRARNHDQLNYCASWVVGAFSVSPT